VEIPDEFKGFLFCVDVSEKLTNSLGAAFPYERFRRGPLLERIASLIFVEGLLKIVGGPRDKSSAVQWKRVINRVRIVANYKRIAEETGIPQRRLRDWCPRIIEATISAMDEQFRSFVRRLGEDEVNYWYMLLTNNDIDICQLIRLGGMKNFFLYQLIDFNFILKD
jgi:hypothetical protein